MSNIATASTRTRLRATFEVALEIQNVLDRGRVKLSDSFETFPNADPAYIHKVLEGEGVDEDLSPYGSANLRYYLQSTFVRGTTAEEHEAERTYIYRALPGRFAVLERDGGEYHDIVGETKAGVTYRITMAGPARFAEEPAREVPAVRVIHLSHPVEKDETAGSEA